jgi:hypothetical protein
MLKIFRPIRTDFKTQSFGANLSCAKTGSDGKIITPYQVLPGVFPGTCPVGSTKLYPALGLTAHNGEDWATYYGEPIFFPVMSEGIEWFASSEIDQNGGIGVNVRSVQPVALESLPEQCTELSKAQYKKLGGKVYLYFKFWHLKKVNVYDKKPIKPGDCIGWADSTGISGGNHLHWSMKISDETSWFTLDGDNGYQGALDFDKWFTNQFVGEVLFTDSSKVTVISEILRSLGDPDSAVVQKLSDILKAIGK